MIIDLIVYLTESGRYSWLSPIQYVENRHIFHHTIWFRITSKFGSHITKVWMISYRFDKTCCSHARCKLTCILNTAKVLWIRDSFSYDGTELDCSPCTWFLSIGDIHADLWVGSGRRRSHLKGFRRMRRAVHLLRRQRMVVIHRRLAVGRRPV